MTTLIAQGLLGAMEILRIFANGLENILKKILITTNLQPALFGIPAQAGMTLPQPFDPCEKHIINTMPEWACLWADAW